jgi:hypothetical protein
MTGRSDPGRGAGGRVRRRDRIHFTWPAAAFRDLHGLGTLSVRTRARDRELNVRAFTCSQPDSDETAIIALLPRELANARVFDVACN